MSTALEPTTELFELEMLGGATERRFRKMRPEIEAMPWGTLSLEGIAEDELIAARALWTSAAYQEHRTGVACAITLQALIEARAPLDLIAVASRFPLDEMAHVELCARMAMDLGGGTELQHDPKNMVEPPNRTHRPLLQAAECAVRYFCVGEALSIPLLRATWHAAKHPLPRAVLGRIVQDEAAHGTFGFTFLDWAAPHLNDADRAFLGEQADVAIAFLREQWVSMAAAPRRHTHEGAHEGDTLSWMQTDDYLALAEKSMERLVVKPLRARGIPVRDGAAS